MCFLEQYFWVDLFMCNFVDTWEEAPGVGEYRWDQRTNPVLSKKNRKDNLFSLLSLKSQWPINTSREQWRFLVTGRKKNQRKYCFCLLLLWYLPAGPDPPCVSFLWGVREPTPAQSRSWGLAWGVMRAPHALHPSMFVTPQPSCPLGKGWTWTSRPENVLPYPCQVPAGGPGLNPGQGCLSPWLGFLWRAVRQQGVKGLNH